MYIDKDIYILLNVLVCSIAVYFYELCSILTPKFLLAKVLNFTRPGGMRRVQISDICTRFAHYLYSRKQSWIIRAILGSERKITAVSAAVKLLVDYHLEMECYKIPD